MSSPYLIQQNQYNLPSALYSHGVDSFDPVLDENTYSRRVGSQFKILLSHIVESVEKSKEILDIQQHVKNVNDFKVELRKLLIFYNDLMKIFVRLYNLLTIGSCLILNQNYYSIKIRKIDVIEDIFKLINNSNDVKNELYDMLDKENCELITYTEEAPFLSDDPRLLLQIAQEFIIKTEEIKSAIYSLLNFSEKFDGFFNIKDITVRIAKEVVPDNYIQKREIDTDATNVNNKDDEFYQVGGIGNCDSTVTTENIKTAYDKLVCLKQNLDGMSDDIVKNDLPSTAELKFEEMRDMIAKMNLRLESQLLSGVTDPNKNTPVLSKKRINLPENYHSFVNIYNQNNFIKPISVELPKKKMSLKVKDNSIDDLIAEVVIKTDLIKKKRLEIPVIESSIRDTKEVIIKYQQVQYDKISKLTEGDFSLGSITGEHTMATLKKLTFEKTEKENEVKVLKDNIALLEKNKEKATTFKSDPQFIGLLNTTSVTPPTQTPPPPTPPTPTQNPSTPTRPVTPPTQTPPTQTPPTQTPPTQTPPPQTPPTQTPPTQTPPPPTQTPPPPTQTPPPPTQTPPPPTQLDLPAVNSLVMKSSNSNFGPIGLDVLVTKKINLKNKEYDLSVFDTLLKNPEKATKQSLLDYIAFIKALYMAAIPEDQLKFSTALKIYKVNPSARKLDEFKKFYGKASVRDYYNKFIEDASGAISQLPQTGGDGEFDTIEKFVQKLKDSKQTGDEYIKTLETEIKTKKDELSPKLVELNDATTKVSDETKKVATLSSSATDLLTLDYIDNESILKKIKLMKIKLNKIKNTIISLLNTRYNETKEAVDKKQKSDTLINTKIELDDSHLSEIDSLWYRSLMKGGANPTDKIETLSSASPLEQEQNVQINYLEITKYNNLIKKITELVTETEQFKIRYNFLFERYEELMFLINDTIIYLYYRITVYDLIKQKQFKIRISTDLFTKSSLQNAIRKINLIERPGFGLIKKLYIELCNKILSFMTAPEKEQLNIDISKTKSIYYIIILYHLDKTY